MCLILQKISWCLHSSDISTEELGFWCLSIVWIMCHKKVLAMLFTLHIVSPTFVSISEESRKLKWRRQCEKPSSHLTSCTRKPKPCVCGGAKSMTRSSSTHISFLSSEGDRVRGLLHRRILAALLFPSPPLLQYYSLVKICLKQETKAVQSLRNHNDEHLRL